MSARQRLRELVAEELERTALPKGAEPHIDALRGNGELSPAFEAVLRAMERGIDEALRAERR